VRKVRFAEQEEEKAEQEEEKAEEEEEEEEEEEVACQTSIDTRPNQPTEVKARKGRDHHHSLVAKRQRHIQLSSIELLAAFKSTRYYMTKTPVP